MESIQYLTFFCFFQLLHPTVDEESADLCLLHFTHCFEYFHLILGMTFMLLYMYSKFVVLYSKFCEVE